MFETLLHADARRRAHLRRDLIAVAIAAGVTALSVYGITQLDPPTRRRVAAAGTSGARPPEASPPASSPAPGRERAAAADPGAPPGARAAPARRTVPSAPTTDPRTAAGARTPAGTGTAASPPSASALRADPGGRATSPEFAVDSGTTESGVTHTIPPRLKQGVAVDVSAWAARTPPIGVEEGGAAGVADGPGRRAANADSAVARTELALESDSGDTSAFAIEPSPPASPRHAAEGTPPGTAGGRADAAEARGRWRVTPRSSGTHRLRLVAVDVRDSAGHIDTTARRTIAAVDVPVDANLSYAVSDALADARRTAATNPAIWLAACLASFLLGWRYGRGVKARDDGRGTAS